MSAALSTLPALPSSRHVGGGHVGPVERVVERRAREPLDVAVLVQRRQRRGQRELVEGVEQQVGGDPGPVVLVGRPVEAGHALELVDAGAADEDVVAALADELVSAAVAEEHIVADDLVPGEDFVEVVAGRAVERAHLDPVVALVAEDALGRPGCRG